MGLQGTLPRTAGERSSAPRQLLAPKQAQADTHIPWFAGGHLPAPLREQAVRRLGLMTLAVAGLCLGFWLLNAFTTRHEIPSRLLRYYRGPAAHFILPALPLLLIAISLWLYRRTRNPAVDRRHLLDLGAGYQIVVAWVLAFVHHMHGWEGLWIYTGWSYVAFVMVTFAAIVPATPRRTLLLAAACVACDVLALVVTLWAGAPVPSKALLAMLMVPDAFAVAFAYFAALVTHLLGQRVEEAERMGSYRLVARLGQGAMGEVWRAEHSTLARPAAIKLIRAEFMASGGTDGPDSVAARFEREAQAAALLCSPHTIRVYDFGQAQDGSFYYVMELLDGIDLDHFVRRFGPMAPARAIPVLRQVCRSLVEAHARGFVHRDIKPANVILCRYGLDVDHVKVVDFGIVKPTSRSHLEDSALTAQGQIYGTPDYLAPEQARGGHPIDGRADLYALGCVAYWLLTGRKVFEHGSALGQIVAHASELPAPVSAHAPVPPALDDVVARCLAKHPQDRFPDAQALESALAVVPLAAPWTDADARAFWEKNLPPDTSLDEAPGFATDGTLPAQRVVSR